MPVKGLIDSIDVASPCDEDWEKMTGSDQRRHCSSCDKDVYNLTAFSRREARKLIMSSGGKICIRYARLPNGRLMTNDTRLHQITRSTAVAASVLAATVSLSAVMYSQGERVPGRSTKSSGSEHSQKVIQYSQISFTIFDQTQAVIPGATVRLFVEGSNIEFIATTDDEGVARFGGVPHGTYLVETTSPGFKSYKNTIRIGQKFEPNVEITLTVGATMGVFVDVWSDIPLFQAIAQEDNEAVRQAVDSGFDIDQKDGRGRTALHTAVEHGNLEIVRLLLEKGAKVNAKDKYKTTPIWMLAEADDEQVALEIFQLLISHGADVNIRNEDKKTLLMQACEDDSVEVVRLLLDAGADPNIKDDEGETAIEKTDSEEIKQLMIHRGARRP